jgi:hypothetical protein
MPDMQQLIAKALNDPAFVKSLIENPAPALQSIGIEPTPELLEAIKGIDAASLQKLAAAFGKDKAA